MGDVRDFLLGEIHQTVIRLEMRQDEMGGKLDALNGRMRKTELAIERIKGMKAGVIMAGSAIGSGLGFLVGAIGLWLKWR